MSRFAFRWRNTFSVRVDGEPALLLAYRVGVIVACTAVVITAIVRFT